MARHGSRAPAKAVQHVMIVCNGRSGRRRESEGSGDAGIAGQALGHARELVRKTFAAWGLAEQAELAELVVTELATNALRHGTGPIDISLCYSGNDLRTEVPDHGTGRPVRRQTTADAEQGRGLELLDGLIDLNGGARGVVDDTDGPGKTVYVVLSLDSSQASIR